MTLLYKYLCRWRSIDRRYPWETYTFPLIVFLTWEIHTCPGGNVRHLETFPRIDHVERLNECFPWSTLARAIGSIDCQQDTPFHLQSFLISTGVKDALQQRAPAIVQRAEIAREKARSQTGHTYHMYVNLRTERVFMGRWNRCEWYSASRRRQRAKRRENRVTASGRNESSDSVTSAGTNSVSLL